MEIEDRKLRAAAAATFEPQHVDVSNLIAWLREAATPAMPALAAGVLKHSPATLALELKHGEVGAEEWVEFALALDSGARRARAMAALLDAAAARLTIALARVLIEAGAGAEPRPTRKRTSRVAGSRPPV